MLKHAAAAAVQPPRRENVFLRQNEDLRVCFVDLNDRAEEKGLKVSYTVLCVSVY